MDFTRITSDHSAVQWSGGTFRRKSTGVFSGSAEGTLKRQGATRVDSDDRLIAATETPLAQVGEFAFLRVVSVSAVGAFLDGGLFKDLLVPESSAPTLTQISFIRPWRNTMRQSAVFTGVSMNRLISWHKDPIMKKLPKVLPGVLAFFLLTGFSGSCEKPVSERSEGIEKAVQRIQEELPALLTQSFVPGATIAVIDGGSIAWQGAFGMKNAETGEPMTGDTVFEAASLSKPVFAYGVMKLVGQGLLDLDRPLVEYIDEASLRQAYPPTRDGDPRYKKIAARHVLTHSTGFPNWFRGGRMVFTFDPGKRFSYSGEAYSFLAAVVAKITGKTFNDFMTETVLTPLGMEDSSYVWLDKYEKRFSAAHNFAGVRVSRGKAVRPMPGASLYTTALDYAKFLVALLNGRDLAESAWKSMLTPQIEVLARDRGNEKVFDWGLGIGLQRTEKGLGFWHWGDNGEFQAYFEVLPAEKRGLIVFLNGVNGQAVSPALTRMVLGLVRPAISTAYFDYPAVDSPDLEMLRAYLSGGFEAFVRKAEEIHSPSQENAINNLGYALLRSPKKDDAVKVFRFNTIRFPQSANTFDSLAEAYLVGGDKVKAVEYYEKALAIDPKLASAIEALKKLKGQRP